MRLVAQAKGGFYAAPPAAVAMAARWLQPPAKERFCILDPCCGHGDAIAQLAAALGCPAQDVYAIELDERRAEAVHKRLGGRGNPVLAPASFFGTGITRHAFSLIWCNPPFDDEMGGGPRVEHTFVERSTHLLVPRGVIALVCPERVTANGDLREFMQSWYTDIRIVEFPAAHRRYGEVVVLGVRRDKQTPRTRESWSATERQRSTGDRPDFVYRLPKSSGPTRFEKTEMTEREILSALTRSPLRRHHEAVEAPSLPTPPMSLGKGHRAMLLAAGHLDGRVCPPGEPPHVVRGTAVKQSYVQSVEEDAGRDGDVTKTVIAERIILTVRVATAAGQILTLTQGGIDQDADDKEPLNGGEHVRGRRKRRVAA